LLIYKFNEKFIQAEFVRRLNKFLVEVRIGNKIAKAHLHDPGRLREILTEGRKLLLIEKGGRRKTNYDVILASMENWVLIHSGYHSMLAEKILGEKLIEELAKYEIEKREFKYGKSRIDFLLANKNKCLLEVKGCTLLKNNTALFPDAPTERGRRHILELIKAKNDGYDVAILFLVMRDARKFTPNWQIDEKFSMALKEAYGKGVKIIACKIKYKDKALYYDGKIKVVI